MTASLLLTLPEIVLTIGALFSAGCGGGAVTVRGAVLYDGKPVEEGSISFESEDGSGPSLGGKIEAGRYDVAAPGGAGKKIVRIRGVLKTGRRIEAGPPAPKGMLVDEIKAQIPSAYNDRSTLTVDVAAGKANEHDFNLAAAK